MAHHALGTWGLRPGERLWDVVMNRGAAEQPARLDMGGVMLKGSMLTQFHSGQPAESLGNFDTATHAQS